MLPSSHTTSTTSSAGPGIFPTPAFTRTYDYKLPDEPRRDDQVDIDLDVNTSEFPLSDRNQIQPAPMPNLHAANIITAPAAEGSPDNKDVFPILDLPPELIIHIFRCVVQSTPSGLDRDRQRLWLSWVCGPFRELALGDSTLWNLLWFHGLSTARSLAFLDRCGTAPLDVIIKDAEYAPSSSLIMISQLDPILDALLPKIDQIRMLYVVVRVAEVAERFISRFSAAGRAAQLAHYEVRVDNPSHRFFGRPMGVQVPLSTSSTPQLQHVSLCGVDLDLTKLSAVNLRSINLSYIRSRAFPSTESWLQILEAAPFLRQLQLEGTGPVPEALSNHRPAHLPSLRMLALSMLSPAYAIHVISLIDAPRLMNLSLRDLGDESDFQFIKTLTGRFPEILLLTLSNLELPASDPVALLYAMVRWLETMPRLKMVRFREMELSLLSAFGAKVQQFWSPEESMRYAERERERSGATTGELPEPVLLPELQYVEFLYQRPYDISTVVEWRKALGRPIKKVYTYEFNVPFVDPEEVARIKEHCEYEVYGSNSGNPHGRGG